MPGMTDLLKILLLLTLLMLPGCLATLPDVAAPPAGSYRVPTNIIYNLSQRTFLLHVPPAYDSAMPLPLVVVLHGAFSTGRQTEEETGFSVLADSERFLVAYPEGIGIFGLLQHWNAGHCCGKAADDQVDDVAFVAEVIATVRRKLAVDPTRIYMAGMSNGGMMTYRFAAERSGTLAAAAVVSGAIGSSVTGEPGEWRIQRPERAVPIIIFHGLEDAAVPAAGGSSSRKDSKRSYLPVTAAIDFWRRADGCESESAATVVTDASVNRMAWDGCRDGSAVEYYLLAGWGHQWPAPWYTNRLGEVDPLRGYNATRQIWEFFSRFRRLDP